MNATIWTIIVEAVAAVIVLGFVIRKLTEKVRGRGRMYDAE